MNLVGAIDIGGTKIAVGLVDASGAILEQEVFPTDRDKDYPQAISRMQELLERCLLRRPGARLMGVGIGCTGPVEPETGVLGPNSFLPLWEGTPLRALLEQVLHTTVAIENDADAAALGETAWGAGRGAERCLYVTVSTGIGCGIVLEGHLYRGAGGAHPELGHIIIEAQNGPPCYCGGRGCWESMASGTALAAWYNAQAEGRSLPNATARDICNGAVQGEALALKAVAREGRYLGIGLANLVTAFVPDVIVLGGGVMASWRLFEEPAREVIRLTCGLVPYERTLLRQASLGARTGLAGAARVWFHRYGEAGLLEGKG